MKSATWMPPWLASNFVQQGRLKQHVKQTCFKELACQEQLEGGWVGKLETITQLCKTKIMFLGPRCPKMGPRGLQEVSWEFGSLFVGPFWAHLGPILGYLGPSWPFSGGPGGHREADVGLGRLDLGGQGSQKLRCHFLKKKFKGNQCFWPISGGNRPSESLQSGCLEVLLWA